MDDNYHPLNISGSLSFVNSVGFIIPGSSALLCTGGDLTGSTPYQGPAYIVPHSRTQFMIVNYPGLPFRYNGTPVLDIPPPTSFINGFVSDQYWNINTLGVCYSGSFRFKKL